MSKVATKQRGKQGEKTHKGERGPTGLLTSQYGFTYLILLIQG